MAKNKIRLNWAITSGNALKVNFFIKSVKFPKMGILWAGLVKNGPPEITGGGEL